MTAALYILAGIMAAMFIGLMGLSAVRAIRELRQQSRLLSHDHAKQDGAEMTCAGGGADFIHCGEVSTDV